MPVSSIAVLIAAATSPSLISRMRAPVARTSLIKLGMAGPVQDHDSQVVDIAMLGLGDLARFIATGASMSMCPTASGPTAILFM